MQKHLMGVKHKKKLGLIDQKGKLPATVVQVRPMMSETQKETRTRGEEVKWKFTCKICTIQTNNDDAMQKHLMGVKHKKKLEVKAQVFCDLCEIYARDDAMMQKHIAGLKHTTMLTGGVYSRKRKCAEGIDGNT